MGSKSERKIPAQRRTEIRALLGRRGGASIAEIADALGGAGSTVRRDLDELDREGAVRRSHGGAVTVEGTAFEHRFEDRRRHNPAQEERHGGVGGEMHGAARERRREPPRRHTPAEKKRIGAFAATLLEAGQSVVFDSSSTVLAAAEALGRRNTGGAGGSNAG